MATTEPESGFVPENLPEPPVAVDEGGPVLVPVAPRAEFPWRKAALVFGASVLGSVLVVPYAMSLMSQVKGSPIPENLLPVVMLFEVFIEAGFAAAAVSIGMGLGPTVGLGSTMLVGLDDGTPDRRRAWRALALASALGVVLAFLLIGAGYAVESSMPAEAKELKVPPPLESFLGSIGAGIREEVWLRLGFMTLLAWLVAKLTRQATASRATIWTANVLAALLFGAIHLPQASSLLGLTGPVVAFVLVGNGVPGVVWGWLYWRKGLVAAIVSHGVADVIMKVIIPLIDG